jgi:hypothetical protein
LRAWLDEPNPEFEPELDPEPEHSLTQDPHPDGNPVHLVGNGGRKQEPWVPPVLTWHEFFKHVTSHAPKAESIRQNDQEYC